MRRGQTFMLQESRQKYELVVEEEEVPELVEGDTSEEEMDEEKGGAQTPVEVPCGDEPLKGSDEVVDVDGSIALVVREASSDFIARSAEQSIETEAVCPDAGHIGTASPPPCEDICLEVVQQLYQCEGTPLWSACGMLAFGTGIAVGAVVGALLFRRR